MTDKKVIINDYQSLILIEESANEKLVDDSFYLNDIRGLVYEINKKIIKIKNKELTKLNKNSENGNYIIFDIPNNIKGYKCNVLDIIYDYFKSSKKYKAEYLNTYLFVDQQDFHTGYSLIESINDIEKIRNIIKEFKTHAILKSDKSSFDKKQECPEIKDNTYRCKKCRINEDYFDECITNNDTNKLLHNIIRKLEKGNLKYNYYAKFYFREVNVYEIKCLKISFL